MLVRIRTTLPFKMLKANWETLFYGYVLFFSHNKLFCPISWIQLEIDNDVNLHLFCHLFASKPQDQRNSLTYETLFQACWTATDWIIILLFAENISSVEREVSVVKWTTKLLSLGCPTQIPVVSDDQTTVKIERWLITWILQQIFIS